MPEKTKGGLPRGEALRGFSLVELLVTLAIVAVLASIILVLTGASRAKARDARRVEDMRQLEYALTLFNSEYGHYPGYSTEGVSLTGEMIGDDDGPIERALRPFMSAGLPRDPMHDGTAYFYSYDPVHCLASTIQTNCACPQGARNGVSLAFNKAEAYKINFRKETFAGTDVNHCNADFVITLTPASL